MFDGVAVEGPASGVGRPGRCAAGGPGLAVSGSTLLGLVHALPDPDAGTVKVLGVDDFAVSADASTRLC
jgi:hypothetical protein